MNIFHVFGLFTLQREKREKKTIPKGGLEFDKEDPPSAAQDESSEDGLDGNKRYCYCHGCEYGKMVRITKHQSTSPLPPPFHHVKLEGFGSRQRVRWPHMAGFNLPRLLCLGYF